MVLAANIVGVFVYTQTTGNLQPRKVQADLTAAVSEPI
jgi:hypothetical protein